MDPEIPEDVMAEIGRESVELVMEALQFMSIAELLVAFELLKPLKPLIAELSQKGDDGVRAVMILSLIVKQILKIESK
jgi:hypothetical protein